MTETDQVGGPARPPVVAAGQPGPRAAVAAIAPDAGGHAHAPSSCARVVRLLKAADGVELKVSVPDADRRSAVAALDMDPLDAQIRQVVFFDTPDLLLDRHGVVVRARRVQGKAGDSIVKLRPLEPKQIAATTRTSPAFGVEIDALPGGFVCSGRMKAKVDNAAVRDAIAGRLPLRKLFTKEQRDLYAAHAPDGCRARRPRPRWARSTSSSSSSRRSASLGRSWRSCGSTRTARGCSSCRSSASPRRRSTRRPSPDASSAAHGIDLVAEQQTKTRTALDYFASELVGGM